MPDYQHPDAFKIVHYRAVDDHDVVEAVWNSRDGVVPRYIALRDGRPARRALWSHDHVAPGHHPAVGSRIFIDLTTERAEQIAEQQGELLQDEGEIAALRAEAIVLGGMLREVDYGAADLVEVTIEMARERGWITEDDPLVALSGLDLRDPYGYELDDGKLKRVADWVLAQDSGQQLDELADQFVMAMLVDELPIIADGYDSPIEDASASRIIQAIRSAQS